MEIAAAARSAGWSARAVAAVVAITAVRLVALAVWPLDLQADEAQYWDWAQDLAAGYYSKPPMVALGIALSTAFCGDGETCIRLPATLAHAATALVVFALATRLFDARIGFFAALVFALLPGVSFSALLITTDPFLILFWALSLLFAERALSGDRWRDWLLLGLCVGLGLLSKFSMVLIYGCFGLFCLWQGRLLPVLANIRTWAAFALSILVYAPNIAWNAAHGWVSYLHTRDNANLAGPLLHPDNALEFLAAQFGVMGPILFAAYLLILARPGDWAADRAGRFLIAFSVPFLAIILLQALLSRAHANWAAPTYVAAAILVAAHLARPGRMAWLTSALILHIGLAAGFYAGVPLAAQAPALPRVLERPLQKLQGWPAVAAEIAELRATHPDAVLMFDDRETLTVLAYYLARREGRDTPPEIVKLPDNPYINDHYELTTDLHDHPGANFLYVSTYPDAGNLRGRFAGVRGLGTLTAAGPRGPERRYETFLLSGFRGHGWETGR